MSTSRFFLPLILIVSILLTSCEKDPYSRCKDDPDCEYIRFKVDGKWWTPDCNQGPLFGCYHTDVLYYENDEYISISSKSENNNEGIYIVLLSVIKIDTILNLYSGPYVSSRFSRKSNHDNCKIYNLIDKEKSKFLLKKIEKSSYLIEGEFSFKVKNDCDEILNITDGEFRLHYRF